jgi:predicted O-methyltransferase YrrM
MTDKTDYYKEKYKVDLELLEKYIKNEYIYNIILKFETIIDGTKHKLRSNINVYEMIFLALLLETNKSRNVLEIGHANGTSGMVITNTLINNGGGNLTSIDPFQHVQWNDVGKYNVNQIIKNNKTNSKISYNLYEKLSSEVLANCVKTGIYYDAIFIDGSHAFLDVVIDIFCSIKILNKNGLMIIDDVLHTGVKLVIDELKNYKNLKKVHIMLDKNNNYKIIDSSYKYNSLDKSYTNPRTMYAYIKL